MRSAACAGAICSGVDAGTSAIIETINSPVANCPCRIIICSSSTGPLSHNLDENLDAFGNHRRIVRDMALVSQNQLKRMLARGKRDLLLGLAIAEMNVVQVTWQRLIQRRRIDIDQKVMMASIGLGDARGRNAHVAQAEANGRVG